MDVFLYSGELTGLNRSLVLGEKFINDPTALTAFQRLREKVQTSAVELPDGRVRLNLAEAEYRVIYDILDKVSQYKGDFDPDFVVDGNENTIEKAKKLRDFFSLVRN